MILLADPDDGRPVAGTKDPDAITEWIRLPQTDTTRKTPATGEGIEPA
jgi:hypothetical protein